MNPKRVPKPKALLKELMNRAFARGYLIGNPEADQVRRAVRAGRAYKDFIFANL